MGASTTELALGGDGEFGDRLAGAVGVVAAEVIGLAVAVIQLAVSVDFVGVDDHHRVGVLKSLENPAEVMCPAVWHSRSQAGR